MVPFLALVMAVFATHSIRGVDPAKLKLYTQKPFACLDGSNAKAVLNDDFCDCLDGSDEPSTSACYNGSFYCKNEGHIPAFISSRQVDDGFCDPHCCDGSDESSGKCPNICIDQAISEVRIAEETERIRKLGAKAKLGLFMKANQMRADKIAEVEQLQASINELKSEMKYQSIHLRELEGSTGINQMLSDLVNKVKKYFYGSEAELSPSNQADQCTNDSPNQESCNNDQINQDLVKNSKDKIDEIQSQLSTMESKIAELNHSISQYPSGEQEAYYALQNTCLEYLDGSYNYKYCWFNNIRQNHLVLGTFDKGSWIVADGRMKFENGEKCYNGPIRHVIVQLVCSPEEKIISIAEPNMCEYFMEIGTASFCVILPEDQANEKSHDEL